MSASLDGERSVARRLGDKTQLSYGDRVAEELVPRADRHRCPPGIEVHDVARLTDRHAESPALADREVRHTVVVPDDPTTRVHKAARTLGTAGVDEANPLSSTHEADVHAVWLLGRS